MVLCRRALWAVAGVACLCCGARGAAATDLSDGRRIILQRGLQIQSLGFVDSTPLPPANYSTWAGAHFTTFSSWYDTNSEKKLAWTMPWSRWMRTDGTNPLTNNETTQHLSEMVSLQYGDELNQDTTGTLDAATTNTIATTFASWHQQYGSDFLAYTNFGANNASKSLTPAALANFQQAANPDMLMFDAYPRQLVTMSTWYTETAKYRAAGIAGNDGTGNKPIPYGQYLDLYRTSYTATLPSESFVRLQEFGSWAFGYTFLSAFVYNKPNNTGVYPTLFSADGDGSPTAVYDQVAEANRQSLNLGPALVRLRSSDVRMIPGSGKSLPSGVAGWAVGAGGSSFMTSITNVTSPGGAPSASYGDTLVGYFEPLLADNSDFPFADGTHFMLVNGSTSGSAAGSAQWYHLTFDFGSSGFDSLQLLNRDTGSVSLVPLTHLTGSQYALDWNLEGGTGDLFRFSNSSSVPEPSPLATAALALVANGFLVRRSRRPQR